MDQSQSHSSTLRPGSVALPENDDTRYWCYLCNKVISQLVAEDQQDNSETGMELLCRECGSGFIEVVATAESFTDVHQVQGAASQAGERGGTEEDVAEGRDYEYSQLVQQLLLENPLDNTETDHGDAENSIAETGHEIASQDDPQNTGIPVYSQFLQQLLVHYPLDNTETDQGDVENPFSETVHEIASRDNPQNMVIPVNTQFLPQLLVHNPLDNTETVHADVENSVAENGQEIATQLDPQNVVTLEDDSGRRDEEDSESGSFTIRVGPYEWDSMDEHVNEEDSEEDDEEDEERDEDRDQNSLAENTDEETRLWTQRTRWRDIRSQHRRRINVEHDLHHYLQQIFENLAGDNLEVRFELPEPPVYVGNPGDYLDARGFEQLLQHLAENDNSRRGAPPAAKTAVENLPSIIVEPKHGSSLCAICKDAVSVGATAKQLPCLHLYHPHCILPWLSTRNSCPICRYELPTDDAEYEEQKGNASVRAHPADNANLNVQDSSQELSSEQLLHVDFHEQDSSQEFSSEVSSHGSFIVHSSDQEFSSGQVYNTQEVDNALVEGNGDPASVSEIPRIPVSSISAESEPGSNTEGVADDENELELVAQESHANGREVNHNTRSNIAEIYRATVSRTFGRGWFYMAAGPVLSVVGLVLVLCFGNHSIGARIQQHVRQLGRQQHDIIRESHIQQMGPSNGVRNHRRWWRLFQR